MIKNKSGKIVNIASVVGAIGNAGQSNYAASKAGIIGFTKSIAKELGSRNIAVNAVAPGWVEVPSHYVRYADYDVQKGGKEIPIGRVGTPLDVAKTCVFLASDDASFIVGATLLVDGGSIALMSLGRPQVAE
jgi:3-oxoacyl-[acyl-carrier protein] reductase